MTNWTAPRTWGASDVPTAAQFNTDVRDNMKHLFETINGFGFPYAPCDPRLIDTAVTIGFSTTPNYTRAYGRGTVGSIKVRIGTSAGNITLGCYENTASEATSKGVPGNRIGTTTSVSCPATGNATVALVGPDAAMEPQDWFGWVGTTGTATGVGWQGSTGWELYQLIDPVLIFTDVDTGIAALPEKADPNFQGSGSSAGIVLVGVA